MEAEAFGEGREGVWVERTGLVVEEVIDVPEGALQRGTEGGFGEEASFGVKGPSDRGVAVVVEGIVLVDEAEVVGEGAEFVAEELIGASAVRALIVREDADGEGRAGGTDPRVSVGVDAFGESLIGLGGSDRLPVAGISEPEGGDQEGREEGDLEILSLPTGVESEGLGGGEVGGVGQSEGEEEQERIEDIGSETEEAEGVDVEEGDGGKEEAHQEADRGEEEQAS